MNRSSPCSNTGISIRCSSYRRSCRSWGASLGRLSVTICAKNSPESGVRGARPSSLRAPPCELVAAVAHNVPVVFVLPRDRRRHRQVGRRVARPLLLVARHEARVIAFIAPADEQRVHFPLQLTAHVEEAGALGCAEALVAMWPRLSLRRKEAGPAQSALACRPVAILAGPCPTLRSTGSKSAVSLSAKLA
jgi:hypothetical protein